MSTYYFDLDTTATSGTGTNVDPANYTQLDNFLTASADIDGSYLTDGDIVRLKGTYINPTTYNLSVFLNITNTVTITSWEDNVPWKIDGVDDYVIMYPKYDYKTIVIKNGIIDSLKIGYGIESNSSILFKNMIFYTSVANGTISDTLIGFYGCTFNNITEFTFDEYYTIDESNAVGFFDCVFINSIPNDGYANYGQFVYGNCTFTDSYIDIINEISATYNDGSVVIFDCDYDWIPNNTLPTSISDIRANTITFDSFNVKNTNTNDRTSTWISDEIYSDSYYSVNRTNRGAFYFGDLEYTEYYINTSGSNTYPYDTPEKGANTYTNLQDNVSFQNNDIINFVTSGGAIDDSGTNAFDGITKSLTFRNYPLDENQCTWLLDAVLSFSGDACTNTTITGLNTSGFYSEWNDETTKLQVYNNTFDSAYNYVFKFITSANCNNIYCENNSFLNIGGIFYINGNITNLNVDNNNFNAVDRLIHFIPTSANMTNLNIYDNNIIDADTFLFFDGIDCNYNNIKIYNNTITSATSFAYLNNTNNIDNLYFYNNNISDVSSYAFTILDLSELNNLQLYNNVFDECTNSIYILPSTTNYNLSNILIKNNNIVGSINHAISIKFGYENKKIETIKNFIKCNIALPIYINSSSSSLIEDVTIENNIIHNGVASCVYLDLDTSAIDNFSCSYNNLINTNDLELLNALLYYSNLVEISATNSRVVNNIFYSETSATDYISFNNFGDDNTIDYNNYYGTISFSANDDTTSGDNNVYGNPLWTDLDNDNYYLLSNSPDIYTGILDDTIGAIPYVGESKIGAFYFGPAEKTFVFNPFDLTLSFVDNFAIIGENKEHIISPLNIYLSIQSPRTLNYSNVTIDFIGIPRKGTSPLIVDFTAYVTLLPEISTSYFISEYKWYFDSDNDLSTSGSSVTPYISHTYTGYKGQQFSVRLDVVLDCK